MARFVEYWTETGALQRESDADLPAERDPAVAALLTIAKVDFTDGQRWNPVARLFETPPPPPPPAQEVSTLVFLRDRLTLPLLAAALARESADPMIAAFRMMLDNASPVNLIDPTTVAGVGYLRAQGILTDADVARILAPVT